MRPRFRTLAQLRHDLAVSLGFGAVAGVIDLQIPMLNVLLQQAQQQLWREVSWRYLFKRHEEDLGVRQKVLDLPDDAGYGRIEAVYVQRCGRWQEVAAGLPRADVLPRGGYPCRYELTARTEGVMQLEFAPVPQDEPVRLAVDYYASPARFDADDDYCSVPDDVLLALAVVKGKAHYRQPDVQLAAEGFNQMLLRAKADNFGADGEAVYLAARAIRAYS